MKVIVAGLPKTGTKSMNAALSQLGFVVYDFLEHTVLTQDEYVDILHKGWSTEDFRRMYQDVDAVVDVPACFFWDEIHKAFPDAKIILTLRENEDIWWNSMQKQLEANDGILPKLAGLFSPTYRRARTILNFTGVLVIGRPFIQAFLKNSEKNEQLAKKGYRCHNAYVMSTAPKDKLLIYKCSEGWKPLCEFLGLPTPQGPFPHKNISGSLIEDILDHPIAIQIRDEAVYSLAKATLVTGVIIYCSVKYGTINTVQAAYDQAKGLLQRLMLPFSSCV